MLLVSCQANADDIRFDGQGTYKVWSGNWEYTIRESDGKVLNKTKVDKPKPITPIHKELPTKEDTTNEEDYDIWTEPVGGTIFNSVPDLPV